MEVTPGNPSNPIDMEEVPPEYKDGDTPGKPIDLAAGEDDPQCFICLEIKHDGRYCDLTQSCCGAHFHSSCYEPWSNEQQRRFGSVSCPICRRITLN